MNHAVLDNAASWVNVVYIASVGLTVILSIVALFISHQRASIRDIEVKKIQAYSAQQIALANGRSAEANAVAAEAESRTASATVAQEELRKQNLMLSMQLEQERKLRLELEERIARGRFDEADRICGAPRALTDEQDQTLVSSLRRFPHKQVSVVQIGDPEAAHLAEQILDALSKSQWTAVVSRVGTLVPPQYGIICTHSIMDHAAAAFVQTLRSFNLRVYERNSEETDQSEILVGLNEKPPASR
jgi:hypothetical protein